MYPTAKLSAFHNEAVMIPSWGPAFERTGAYDEYKVRDARTNGKAIADMLTVVGRPPELGIGVLG